MLNYLLETTWILVSGLYPKLTHLLEFKILKLKAFCKMGGKDRSWLTQSLVSADILRPFSSLLGKIGAAASFCEVNASVEGMR